MSREAKRILLDEISSQLDRHCGDDAAKRERMLKEAFLFSFLMAVVTPEWTTVIGLGDGVFGINGDFKALTSSIDARHPCFVGYALRPELELEEQTNLQAHRPWPTKQVESICIGSDGVMHLLAAEKKALARSESRALNLKQLTDPDKLRANPNFLQAELRQTNVETAAVRIYSGNGKVVSCGQEFRRGFLPDDTTLAVLLRRPE